MQFWFLALEGNQIQGWLFLLFWGDRGRLNLKSEEFAYSSPPEVIFIGQNCPYILQKVALNPIWFGAGERWRKKPKLLVATLDVYYCKTTDDLISVLIQLHRQLNLLKMNSNF